MLVGNSTTTPPYPSSPIIFEGLYQCQVVSDGHVADATQVVLKAAEAIGTYLTSVFYNHLRNYQNNGLHTRYRQRFR